LKLKIGDYEVPEHCLRSVVLYSGSSFATFAGVFVGEQELEVKTGLRRLAEMRAMPFEVVDRNGVTATGVCDIKNLKFEGESTPVVKFSGRLTPPFQD
jgi:hypothetical protein